MRHEGIFYEDLENGRRKCPEVGVRVHPRNPTDNPRPLTDYQLRVLFRKQWRSTHLRRFRVAILGREVGNDGHPLVNNDAHRRREGRRGEGRGKGEGRRRSSIKLIWTNYVEQGVARHLSLPSLERRRKSLTGWHLIWMIITYSCGEEKQW